MSGPHEIVWTFEQDGVRGRAVCSAQRDSDCRLRCTRDCEMLNDVDRDGNGWFHLTQGEWDEERHPLVDSGLCNVVEWLNANGDIDELADGRQTFEVGRVSIRPVWQGEDGALWVRT